MIKNNTVVQVVDDGETWSRLLEAKASLKADNWQSGNSLNNGDKAVIIRSGMIHNIPNERVYLVQRITDGKQAFMSGRGFKAVPGAVIISTTQDLDEGQHVKINNTGRVNHGYYGKITGIGWHVGQY